MKPDGFILDFTEFYIGLRDPSNGGKASYHARTSHFAHSTYRHINSAEAKLFCLRLFLCTWATQPALEKCICVTWSQLFNCISNPPSASLWNCPRVWLGSRYNPTKHVSPTIYHSFSVHHQAVYDLLFATPTQQHETVIWTYFFINNNKAIRNGQLTYTFLRS